MTAPPSARRRAAALAPLLAVALAGSCQSEPVRLHELREAPEGSAERAAYERLGAAVELANEFLETSEAARGFPAESARFALDHSDLLLDLAEEGILPLRIETSGWADPRTALGDGVHPTERGFLSARRAGPSATGSGTADSAFLLLEPPEMAALLLRQAATMREIRARGELDYWLNWTLLGLEPGAGWRRGSPVDARAQAVADAFLAWHAQRRAAGAPG